MFIDRVRTTQAELALVDEKTGLFSSPPDGLVAAIATGGDDDAVDVLMVWESPGARGDFGMQMMPLVESGEVTSKPDVLTPHRVYVRGT